MRSQPPASGPVLIDFLNAGSSPVGQVNSSPLIRRTRLFLPFLFFYSFLQFSFSFCVSFWCSASLNIRTANLVGNHSCNDFVDSYLKLTSEKTPQRSANKMSTNSLIQQQTHYTVYTCNVYIHLIDVYKHLTALQTDHSNLTMITIIIVNNNNDNTEFQALIITFLSLY